MSTCAGIWYGVSTDELPKECLSIEILGMLRLRDQASIAMVPVLQAGSKK